jgi:uncharacterized protein
MPARPLSIVTNALEARGPALKALAEGQVLVREGDPPGPLYVICSGSVRAYRRSLTQPDAIEELARLGPGDVVGELAPMLQQLRSATVQALEPTRLLEVPSGQLATLLQRHDSLLRVLTSALRDRAGLTPADIEAVAARLGVSAPDASSVVIPPPAHDPTFVYPKSLVCPACGAQFSALITQPRKDQPAERSSDFHQLYRTSFNPYDYELWVCPNDLYAALSTDFEDLSQTSRSKVPEVIAEVVSSWSGVRPEFNGERTLELRERALELALALYRMRGLPAVRQAAILHRLAWCARERGDAATEQTWLRQALEAYITAYTQSDLVRDGKREELRVLYLCGELSARTGDIRGAVQWFGEALRDQKAVGHPSWERMIRERWSAVRAQSEEVVS